MQGAINAVEAITYSACFYVFRCLLRDDVPATSGLMRPIRVIAPPGTVVNAKPPAAVAGGNVETSQRIVDVLLKALAQAIPDRIPAAAAGTMNNLTIGGIDLRLGNRRSSDDPRTGEPFAYYETIAGGMGARPTKDGVSGVHTHMTNSLNTPAEALEYAYPIRSAAIFSALQQWRRGSARRWRRNRPRNRSLDRRPSHPARRPPFPRTLRLGGRNRRRSRSHPDHSARWL